MLYSLTDKLKFNEPPQIEVNGKKLTVKNDAEIVLELMDIVQNSGETDGAKSAVKLLFSEKDQKIIAGFKLSIEDYMTLATTALQLALGNDPDEISGEVESRTTK